jgi:hypothetical protein
MIRGGHVGDPSARWRLLKTGGHRKLDDPWKKWSGDGGLQWIWWLGWPCMALFDPTPTVRETADFSAPAFPDRQDFASIW